MKNSMKNSPGLHKAEQEICNEKKCITCFENRGCIYDRYYTDMPSFNAENSQTEKEMNAVKTNANEGLNM